ncbi:UNVERIFIED_ORG: hypothetical protein ABIC97_004120 [Peribacillus simplex]
MNEQDNPHNIESLQKEIDKIEGRKKKWQYAWSSYMISDDDFRSRMDEERNREIEVQIKYNLLNRKKRYTQI